MRSVFRPGMSGGGAEGQVWLLPAAIRWARSAVNRWESGSRSVHCISLWYIVSRMFSVRQIGRGHRGSGAAFGFVLCTPALMQRRLARVWRRCVARCLPWFPLRIDSQASSVSGFACLGRFNAVHEEWYWFVEFGV